MNGKHNILGPIFYQRHFDEGKYTFPIPGVVVINTLASTFKQKLIKSFLGIILNDDLLNFFYLS